jgi:hypothetical protein
VLYLGEINDKQSSRALFTGSSCLSSTQTIQTGVVCQTPQALQVKSWIFVIVSRMFVLSMPPSWLSRLRRSISASGLWHIPSRAEVMCPRFLPLIESSRKRIEARRLSSSGEHRGQVRNLDSRGTAASLNGFAISIHDVVVHVRLFRIVEPFIASSEPFVGIGFHIDFDLI